jgi:hypothetical protein
LTTRHVHFHRASPFCLQNPFKHTTPVRLLRLWCGILPLARLTDCRAAIVDRSRERSRAGPQRAHYASFCSKRARRDAGRAMRIRQKCDRAACRRFVMRYPLLPDICIGKILGDWLRFATNPSSKAGHLRSSLRSTGLLSKGTMQSRRGRPIISRVRRRWSGWPLHPPSRRQRSHSNPCNSNSRFSRIKFRPGQKTEPLQVKRPRRTIGRRSV